MSKPNFEMAQNSATNFLLSHNIKSLAFNPKDLNLVSEGIIIDTIENYAKLTNQPITCFIGRNIDDCYVIKAQDYSIILYRENSTVSEEHRTLSMPAITAIVISSINAILPPTFCGNLNLDNRSCSFFHRLFQFLSDCGFGCLLDVSI